MRTKPATKRRSKPATSNSCHVVRYQDGRVVTYDPALPLKQGCKVIAIYPAQNKGKPRTASDVGVLDSTNVKSSVLWVIFEDEEYIRRQRIDRSAGAVVARVTGIMTPVPLADDPKPTGRARS